MFTPEQLSDIRYEMLAALGRNILPLPEKKKEDYREIIRKIEEDR